MKLTRLRLIGFKSFVEPTDFLIERDSPAWSGRTAAANPIWSKRCAG